MKVVSLFFVSVSSESVNNFTIVVFSVVDGIAGTHNGYVKLSVTSTNVVPVDEVNVSKLTFVPASSAEAKL